MSKEKKNPFIAGGLNMVMPGSCYLYVENDRTRFIKTFIGTIVLIAVMVMLGNAIQDIRGFSLPQGLCTASLLLVILVPLFLIGQKTAHMHNSMIDQNAYYNIHRTPSKGTNDAKLTKIQNMRNEGLISEQELQKKTDDMSLKEQNPTG